MAHDLTRQFSAALDTLVEQIRQDRSILAALLCGSLAHDTVWAKSDIDLMLVTIDDSKVPSGSISLNAQGVNVHAFLIPRAEFRRTVEGAVQNSFIHSLLAKGRLLYTHDETIARLCEGLRDLGARDKEIQLLRAAIGTLPAVDKAHKWFVTRADLDYTALWILYAATGLAAIEVIDAGMVADREVIPRAMGLNPALFDTIYVRLLNAKKTKAIVVDALRDCRSLPCRARPVALRPSDCVSSRGRRSALVHGARGSFQAAFRRDPGDHGVRVPGGSGAHQQGVCDRAADQAK